MCFAEYLSLQEMFLFGDGGEWRASFGLRWTVLRCFSCLCAQGSLPNALGAIRGAGSKCLRPCTISPVQKTCSAKKMEDQRCSFAEESLCQPPPCLLRNLGGFDVYREHVDEVDVIKDKLQLIRMADGCRLLQSEQEA